MNKFVLPMVICLLGATAAMSAENCTKEKKRAVCADDKVREKVDWACNLVKEKGEGALDEIRVMRYDCCGEPNYVWINDMHPKMVMHPLKPMLDGEDLTTNKDPQGKALFVEFVKAVKAAPSSAAWVDYQWSKFGEKQATPKKSWVKKCEVGRTGNFWIVGSGTWK